MSRRLFLLFAIVLILALSACGGSAGDEESDSSVYRVTKSTGLYDAFDLDAKMLDELAVGTELIPANDATELSCDTITESGTDYTLCRMEVVDTGASGWVLKKWIEKK